MESGYWNRFRRTRFRRPGSLFPSSPGGAFMVRRQLMRLGFLATRYDRQCGCSASYELAGSKSEDYDRIEAKIPSGAPDAVSAHIDRELPNVEIRTIVGFEEN